MLRNTKGDKLEVTELAKKRNAHYIGPEEVIFNLEEWEMRTNFNIMGSSKNIHQFDYALISRKDRSEVIPIGILTGSKQERMDSLLVLYMKSKDLSLNRRYALSSQTVTPYENFLAGIFNVPIAKSILLRDEENSIRISAEGLNRSETVILEVPKPRSPEKSTPEGTVKEDRSDSAGRHRRDHTMIMHDVLSLAKTYGDLGITNIIYKCNLNYRSALRTVNELLENRLIEISDTGGAKQKYKITKKGISMLEDMRRFTFSHDA